MTKATWAGVAAAVAISVAVGVTVHLTVGDLTGKARLLSFAAISAVATGVLTWMIFWMRRQSRAIKGELEHKVDSALGSDHAGRAVAMVAFFAVLREGIEAALFLIAAATESQGREVVLGASIGITIAIALGLMVYLGGRRLPMRAFFQVTGVIVIVFAAGLIARTVLFLQSAEVIGSFNDAVYNLTDHRYLTQQTEFGKFLAAMLGWDPRPSIEQVVAWLGYIVPVGYLFLRPHRDEEEAEVAAEVAEEIHELHVEQTATDRGDLSGIR
jgi:high-affinity iron transporter